MSKITEKIAKLLALAESPYEEEAKAALLQARRLMAEHKLMPEDIEPQENKKVIQECVGVTCTKLSSPWTEMAVMMAVPALRPVTLPSPSTVATLELLLIQTMK